MAINDGDKKYITKLILPLMGLSEEEVLFASDHITRIDLALMASSGDKISDFELIDGKTISINYLPIFSLPSKMTIEFKKEVSEDSFKLFKYLFQSYGKYNKGNFNERIPNALINEKLNDLILQKGLFAYLLDDVNFTNNKIDDLFKILQRWSEKTYEGHNVCYGFLINPDIKLGRKPPLGSGDFVDFIGEEYSAVFTDGIASIVEINPDCDFVEYHSILHDKSSLPDNYDGIMLPIRFAHIIYENVTERKIGLFLLTNGDVIFAKRQEISFVRRGGRWLNFSFKSFYDIVSEYVKREEGHKELIRSIYCSCLDISFSHSGGLIAVVDPNNNSWKEAVDREDNPIVSELDFISPLDLGDSFEALEKLNSQKRQAIEESKNPESIKCGQRADLEKRITKKYYLTRILKDGLYFPKIDRKLRAELSGLDGAMILDISGNIIACGAIIANKSGSSGGGRGSAARTLSKYGGFAIKISTDGYIEAFFDESRIYAIK